MQETLYITCQENEKDIISKPWKTRSLNESVYNRVYLYKLGASSTEDRPPKIHTFPTTNHTAKKQSKDILKYSTSIFILCYSYEQHLGTIINNLQIKNIQKFKKCQNPRKWITGKLERDEQGNKHDIT